MSIHATVFLFLTGLMATAVAAPGGMRIAARVAQDWGMLLLAAVSLGVALWLVFPNGPWLFPAALSVNGAACIAHGLTLNRSLRFGGGFLFCALGGMQLGLVLIQGLMANEIG